MADMTPIKRAADAAWAHLEALYENGKGGNDPAYVSREISVVDGVVDMPALVRAVIAAIREPSEEMVAAAVLSTVGIWPEDRDDHREVQTEFRAMIDQLLAEGL